MPTPPSAAGAPSVTVVVPAYNRAAYIAEALESVFQQRYEPLDVVVVDDGSTDATAAVASSFPVRCLSTDHRGVAAARNRGLDSARGDLIAFLDADDAWTDGSLARRVRHLREHPRADFVLGRTALFGDTARLSLVRTALVTETQPGVLTTFVGWRAAVEAVGRFDESYALAEDVDWFARARDAGIVGARLDDVCARYRVHWANTTLQHRAELGPSVARALQASLERRRARSGR